MNNDEKLAIVRKIFQAWQGGDLRYKMHEGQLQIHSVLRALPPTVRIRMMECCRGYGKSTLNVLMACEDCAKPHPLNYPVRIIGPEKDQTVEIVAQIFDIIGPEAPPGWIRRHGSTWYVGHNRVIVSGFNRGSIERLRGKRAKSIYLEEIRDVPSESLEYGLKSILLPLSLLVKCPITAATTSASQILHTMNTYFKNIAMENEGYFHFDIFDCPLYTQVDIDQAISDCGGEETEDFQREYLCLSVDTKVQRAIPAFDPARHVGDFDFPKTDFKRWMITDIGGLRDPSHCLVFFYDESVRKVRVKSEQVWVPQTPTSTMVERLREIEEESGIYSDDDEKPSFLDCPGQFMVDLQEEHVYRAQFVQKGRFEESVKSLNQAFFDGQIEVHKDCVQLIHQLVTGKLNKAHSDFERELAVGDLIAHHCDGIAAAMYGWRMRDVARIRTMPRINTDNQWIHPKLLEQMRETIGEKTLEAIKPKMKRF
jgi:hypothetical protein